MSTPRTPAELAAEVAAAFGEVPAVPPPTPSGGSSANRGVPPAIELAAAGVAGPEDVLVLAFRDPMAPVDYDRLRDRLETLVPALAGRVLVVDGCAGLAVVRGGALGRPT